MAVEDESHTSKAQLGDYVKDQTKEFAGSWFDFSRYFTQRRILLAHPDLIVSHVFPSAADIPPLKFAVQGLLLVIGLAAFIGLTGRLVLREPSNPAIEITDSQGRMANIEQQLHFFLDVRDTPPTGAEDIDQIAHSILRAPTLRGVQANEIQAVLDGEKRNLHGLPTKSSRLDDARVEVRKRLLDARVQLFKAQHRVEPKGLPGNELNDQMDFINEHLGQLNYDDASETITNVDAVAQQLINAPELSDATPGFLSVWLEWEQSEVKGHREAERVRAASAIKVLDRMIVVERENSEHTKQTQERIEEVANELRPVLVALGLVLAAYIFRVLIRLGKSRPRQNLDKADTAYFYLFTGAYFWVFAALPMGVLAYKLLWKVSWLGLGPLVAIGVACGFVYLLWALKLLWSVSEKLRVLFGTEPSKHFYNVYQGSSKIRIDLVLSSILGSFLALALGAAVTFSFVEVAKLIGPK